MTAARLATPERRAAYAREGCVHVPGAFDRDEIADLLAGVDAAIAGGAASLSSPDDRFVQPDPFIDAGHGAHRLLHVLSRVPAMRDWLDRSIAAELVARMTGADSVCFWLDATFAKAGDAPEAATPWHVDESTFGLVGEQLPSLWIALTDVEEDNAPLTTIPGSHRDPWRYQSQFAPPGVPLPEGFRPVADLRDVIAAATAAGRVAVWPARAGDVLLIHPKTIHGSRPRAPGTPGRRVAFSTRWIGSDARWRPNAFSFPLELRPGGAPLVVGEGPPEDSYPIVWRMPRDV